MRNFDELGEREILALAIASEEEDGRIYLDFAEGLHADYPASAQVFTAMAAEEDQHRRWLIELYRRKFGEHIPLIKREHVRGFVQRKPVWQLQPLNLDAVRHQAEEMEFDSARFYRRAAARSTDASIRKLLGDLAAAEVKHERAAERIMKENLTENALAAEAESARRMLVLRFIQPGLAGLMDGSVSTLAPVFAAAFATGASMLALVVSKCVLLGTMSPGFSTVSEEDSLGGASLVRGDDVPQAGDVPHRGLEAVEGVRAGVGFVAAHHAGPLVLGHRSGAGVGQQIDQHLIGPERKGL